VDKVETANAVNKRKNNDISMLIVLQCACVVFFPLFEGVRCAGSDYALACARASLYHLNPCLTSTFLAPHEARYKRIFT